MLAGEEGPESGGGGDRVFQPVHEFSVTFEGTSAPSRFYTHLGSDCGPIEPGDRNLRDDLPISWLQGGAAGRVHLNRATSGRAGMWHSLSGLAREKDRYLDFAKCYPYLRDEYQPRCVGMTVSARGEGILLLELKSPEGRVLWWATRELCTGDEWRELSFSWSPDDLRRVKFLNWVVEPGANLSVGPIRLHIEMPAVPFEERVFLASYAKLARSHSAGDAFVREYAHLGAGELDSIPASGLFCLATCAAHKMGVVRPAFAEQVLRKTHAAVSNLPRARGLLPGSVRKYGGKYRVHQGTEYSTIGTALYYHSMLLAAQLLWDGKTLAGLVRAVRSIEFDQLRDAGGYVVHGLADDGRTPLATSWRDWGGEAALVLLLEHVATGCMMRPKLDGAGKVRNGVGLSAEIQSLLFADFSSDEPDAVTGVNWLGARRALLAEQRSYFPRQWPGTEAARLGFYGLSAGVGPGGVGQVVNGTASPGRAELIHPHYVVMSGLVESDPSAVFTVLRAMESRGLFPPWGIVENFTKDLERLPLLGSVNAAFECLSAYHLWARAARSPDEVYRAAEFCAFLWEAMREFYPHVVHW